MKLQAAPTECSRAREAQGYTTVFGVEAADGPWRAPDRAAAAQDDPVDVERDAKGRPLRGRRGVGETLGEIRRPLALRGLELRPRPRPRPRRADQRRAEAPHAAPPCSTSPWLYGLRLPSEPEASGSAAGRVLRLVFYCG